MMETKYFHDAFGGEATDKDLGEEVILVSDPLLVPTLAKRLVDSKELFSHYEFVAFSGRMHGRSILICSTGLGGGSASIAIDNLANLGLRRFIFLEYLPGVGSSEEPTVEVALGTARLDGASLDYAPQDFPAISDPLVFMALLESVKNRNMKSRRVIFCGSIGQLSDGELLALQDYDQSQGHDLTHPVPLSVAHPEISTTLTLASLYSLRAGAIKIVSPGEGSQDAYSRMMEIAVDTFRLLEIWAIRD